MESNLLTLTELILSTMHENAQVNDSYIDFAKAFDKIRHDTLLFKLWQLWMWLSSMDTFTRVQPLCCYSFAYKNISYGVPQGSHLGPLLFILYVNDLPKSINHSNMLFYADDTKLYRVKGNKRCCVTARRFKWFCCNSHDLFLTPDKCFTISFTRKKSPIMFPYKICERDRNRVTEIRDLSVVMDSKISFILHIDKIIDTSYIFGLYITRGKTV